jgi:hypothetical protein
VGLGVAAIRVSFTIAAADGLINFDASKLGVDLAGIDAIVFDGFGGPVAGGGQAEEQGGKQEQMSHVFPGKIVFLGDFFAIGPGILRPGRLGTTFKKSRPLECLLVSVRNYLYIDAIFRAAP